MERVETARSWNVLFLVPFPVQCLPSFGMIVSYVLYETEVVIVSFVTYTGKVISLLIKYVYFGTPSVGGANVYVDSVC